MVQDSVVVLVTEQCIPETWYRNISGMNELLMDHVGKTFTKKKGKKLRLQDLNNICELQCASKKGFWKKTALYK